MPNPLRLVLSPLRPSDLDVFHALLTNPLVRRYLLDGQTVSRNWTRAQIVQSVRAMKRTGLGLWTVRQGPRGPVMGVCGFRPFHDPDVPELMYALRPEFWGRGYADVVARAVCRRGYERGMRTIVAGADEPNIPSIRVLERLGLRRFAKRPSRFFGREWRYRLPAARFSRTPFSRTRSTRSRCAIRGRP